MKHKKNLLFIVLFLIGCNNNNSVIVSEKESDEPIVFVDFKTIKIEQNEKYYYGNIIKEFKDISIDVLDNNIASITYKFIEEGHPDIAKEIFIYERDKMREQELEMQKIKNEHELNMEDIKNPNFWETFK